MNPEIQNLTGNSFIPKESGTDQHKDITFDKLDRILKELEKNSINNSLY